MKVVKMPDNCQTSIVKSKSVQGLRDETRDVDVDFSNIFERQVDLISRVLDGDKTGDNVNKSSTLPPDSGKSDFLHNIRKTNSLKRSITLPKNPFSSTKKGKKSGMKSMAHSSTGDKENKVDDQESGTVESEPTKSSRKIVKTDSVKNFFSNLVTHISTSSLGRSKYDISEIECRTKEWRSYFEQDGSKVPGVIGIRNHGNTCFINSILQCLSFTDVLAEYFVLDQYKYDLKRRKRLSAFAKASSGTGKGEVTEQLATLLKSLWSLQYDPEISDKFKSLVDKYGSQYKGGSQHDAQEFLLWLLDRVHEELNTATKKKYKRLKNLPGRPDDVLAAESLANYTRCNNSFVVDIFQAQFRSSLTCPSCERQSNTFDPFLCVSLPIPHKQMRPVIVTVLYIDQSPRQVRIGLSLPVESDVKELRDVLSRDTGIETSQLLLVEIDSLSFQKTFSDDQPLSIVSPDCLLFGIEVPKLQNSSEDHGAFMVLTWVNVFKEGDMIEKRFGTPYTIQVSRETIYGDLQKLLMKEMSPILHDDILISAQKVPLFKIRVLDGFDGKTYLDDRVEMPLYMECIETAMNMCLAKKSGGPAHVQLVLEWDMPAKTQIIADDLNPVEEHSSVKQVKDAPEDNSSVSLQECFSLYTSEERLGKDDAFFCPQCNKKREVVKKLGVWSVPDVLVIHLKRFKQSTRSTKKLETLVDIPLENFDMSPNMARRGSDNIGGPPSEPTSNASSGLKVFSAFSPWKHPKRFRPGSDRDDTIYELYSVCNHHGSDLQGGHYTAFCKNPTDDQWYLFDDVHTKQVQESDVTTKDAYILFYQKSCLSASSSSSSSSSGSNQEHWVYRMPDFYYKAKSETKCAPTTKPRTTLKNEAKQSQTSSPTVKKGVVGSQSQNSFKRSSAKYATLPAKRTSDIIHLESDNHSDTEQGVKEDSSDEEEEGKITNQSLKT